MPLKMLLLAWRFSRCHWSCLLLSNDSFWLKHFLLEVQFLPDIIYLWSIFWLYYNRRSWHLLWRWQWWRILFVEFWYLAKIQLFLSLNLKSLALYSFGRLVVPFLRLIQGGVHGGVHGGFCKSLLKLYIIKNPISRSNSSTCFLSIYTGIQVFISLDEAVSSDVCSISWS